MEGHGTDRTDIRLSNLEARHSRLEADLQTLTTNVGSLITGFDAFKDQILARLNERDKPKWGVLISLLGLVALVLGGLWMEIKVDLAGQDGRIANIEQTRFTAEDYRRMDDRRYEEMRQFDDRLREMEKAEP